ncbi:MAG: protein kinase domain-containing protein [Myxococcota bacterium]
MKSSHSKYKLLRRVGRGGMGEVHLAMLEAPGGVRRLVAVKTSLEASSEFQTALFAEARLAALLTHPNVAQLIDAGLDGERAWFAMEYVDGLSLLELMEGPERLPAWTWARLFADACAALHAVHEARDEQGARLNVVHRDITPQNLLVGWNGVLKLVDFGIARSALQNRMTTTGVVRGKLGYMSPEQASSGSVDRRSDVFALGVLLWEALANRRLFQGKTESETLARVIRAEVPALASVAPSVPAALIPIVERALQVTPAARFASALEMQRALEMAMCDNGIVIGANEVAHVLAQVAPQGASHPAWPTPTEAETNRVAAPNGSTSRRSGVSARWLAAGALVALVPIAVLARSSAQNRAESKPAASAPPKALVNDQKPVGAATPILQQAPPPAASIERNPAPAFESQARALATSTLQRPLVSSAPPRSTSTSTASALPARATASSDPSSSPPRPSESSETSDSTSTAASVNISSRPVWATIHIDGQARGSTPLAVRNLKPGSHTIEAYPLGNGPARSKVVSLSAGEVARVEFNLE